MDVNYFLNENPLSEKLVREIAPQTLAFVGDAVHTLFVRVKLVETCEEKTEELHKKTSAQVRAKSQSMKVDKILEMLSEDEIYFYKRGRNVSSNNSAKNASILEYRRATGFESLVGYLFLTAQYERLGEILKKSEE
ncbi:MAG: ribonuclease III domain-containing protein [Clostridia bacterium]